MKLFSLNCRGLNDTKKRFTIFKHCEKYDIACLQETYITNEKATKWSLGWKGLFFQSSGTTHSKGNIILIRNGFNAENIMCIHSSERIIALKLTVDNKDVIVVNIYAPFKTNEKVPFIEELEGVLKDLKADHNSENVILCGDFNMLQDQNLDNVSGGEHDKKCTQRFVDFTKTNQFLVL